MVEFIKMYPSVVESDTSIIQHHLCCQINEVIGLISILENR